MNLEQYYLATVLRCTLGWRSVEGHYSDLVQRPSPYRSQYTCHTPMTMLQNIACKSSRFVFTGHTSYYRLNGGPLAEAFTHGFQASRLHSGFDDSSDAFDVYVSKKLRVEKLRADMRWDLQVHHVKWGNNGPVRCYPQLFRFMDS